MRFHACYAALAALVLLAAGCGSDKVESGQVAAWQAEADNGRDFAIHIEPSQPVRTPLDGEIRTGSAVWSAAFSGQSLGLDSTKQVSFSRANLLLAAASFDDTLPRQNATVNEQQAVLELAPAGAGSLGDWAFAGWTLDLPGFAESDFPQTINVVRSSDTRTNPLNSQAAGNEWIGLANVETNTWDFYALPLDVLLVESFAPYTSVDGKVRVTVLARGSGVMQIRELRLGEPKLVREGEEGTPFFDGTPTVGFAPLAQTFTLPGDTRTASSTSAISNTATGSLVLESRYPTRVDLAASYPLPRDQGRTYACTAFATSNALSYALARNFGHSVRDRFGVNDINRILSVPDIYLESRRDPDDPTNYPIEWQRQTRSLYKVLQWLQNNNVPREAFEEFAVYGSQIFTVRGKPINNNGIIADRGNLNTKLRGFHAIFDSQNNLATRRDQINQMRQRLSQGQPIVISVRVDSAFRDLSSGDAGWNYVGTGDTYYHAMTVVGYDDAYVIGSSRGAFKLLNSYSARWGQGGYAWVGYETFERGLSEIDAWWLEYYYKFDTAVYLSGPGQGIVTPRRVSRSDTPLEVTASAGIADDFITVSWTECPGASGYYIFRDAWPESEMELAGFAYGWFQAPAEVLAFDDYALPPTGDNLAHIYRVLPLVAGRPRFDLMSPESGRGYPCRPPSGVNVLPAGGEPGAEVTLTAVATISCPTRVVWDFGSAAAPARAEGQSVLVTLGASGDHPCRVTLTTEEGTLAHDFTLQIAPIAVPITGKVLALDGSPLAGARVVLDSSSSGVRSTSALDETTSGPDGSFVFPAVPRGAYDVRALLSGWGFAPLARVNVRDNTPPADVTMLGFTAPTARLRLAYQPGELTARFDATGTFDADGGSIATYRWDFDSDGEWDHSGPSPLASHTYAKSGAYVVTVQAEDDDNPSDTGEASLRITVDDTARQPPVASFTATPANGRVVLQVELDAAASHDPDGGRITVYEWDFDNDGCYDRATTIAKTSKLFTSPGTVTIGLRVSDDEGKTATVKRTVTVLPSL